MAEDDGLREVLQLLQQQPPVDQRLAAGAGRAHATASAAATEAHGTEDDSGGEPPAKRQRLGGLDAGAADGLPGGGTPMKAVAAGSGPAAGQARSPGGSEGGSGGLPATQPIEPAEPAVKEEPAEPAVVKAEPPSPAGAAAASPVLPAAMQQQPQPQPEQRQERPSGFMSVRDLLLQQGPVGAGGPRSPPQQHQPAASPPSQQRQQQGPGSPQSLQSQQQQGATPSQTQQEQLQPGSALKAARIGARRRLSTSSVFGAAGSPRVGAPPAAGGPAAAVQGMPGGLLEWYDSYDLWPYKDYSLPMQVGRFG